MSNDPFTDAPEPVSEYPRIRNLKGRLVLFTPSKLEKDIPSNFKDKDGKPQLQDRVTTDMVVLDGPLEDFDDVEFENMWVSNSALVKQLSKAAKRGGMVLGRIGLPDPKGVPGTGNPWMLMVPTEEDRQVARDYLAGLEDDDPFAV